MKNILLTLLLFVFSFSNYAQEFKWAFNATSSVGSIGYQVASDSKGNHIFATQIRDTTWFLGNEYVAYDFNHNDWDGTDILILKMDSLGNMLWGNHIGSESDDFTENTHDMISDNQDNLIVCGVFTDRKIYYNNVLQPEPAHLGFIIKISPAGEILWSKSLSAWIEGLAVDTENNIYATGSFSNMAFLDGDTLFGANKGTTSDLCVYKLSQYGDLVWSNHAGTPRDLYAHNVFTRGKKIAVNSDQEVFIAGHLSTKNATSNMYAKFDDISLQGTNQSDMIGFISKQDAQGNFVRVDGGLAELQDIDIDGLDNIVISGQYKGILSNSFIDVEKEGRVRLFVSMIDKEYLLKWFHDCTSEVGWLDDLEHYKVCIDKNNGVYYFGYFKEKFYLSDTVLSTSFPGAEFLFKINTTGQIQWISKLPNLNVGNRPMDISVNQEGKIGFVGAIENAVVFDTLVLDVGNVNFFVSLFDPSKLNYQGSSGIGYVGFPSKKLECYPNPTSGDIFFELIGELNIIIFNTRGQIVSEQHLLEGQPRHISLEKLPSGIYGVIVVQDGTYYYSKVVVTRK